MDEEVAGAADGADVARLVGVVVEFLAEGGDVDVDGAVEDFVFAIADGFEKGFAGLDAALGFHEGGEDVELDGGEDEGLVIEEGDAGIQVEAKGASDEFFDWGFGFDGLDEAGAAGDGAEASEEFASGEGFWEVVVGTDFEADDAVGFVAASGEHEDGDVGSGADAFEDFEAVATGQHEVENDGVPGGFDGTDSAFGSGVDHFDGVAHGFEVVADEGAEFAVIVDDEDAGFAIFWEWGC